MFKILTPALGLSLLASAAFAHVSFEQKEAIIGGTAKFTLRVPHGCDGEATLKLRVQIPAGLVGVKPMPKAGWTLETVTGPYDKAYSTGHAEVTEGVTEIIWTGDLPDAWYDEFAFRGTVTAGLAPDSTLYVPVVQECATGTERWIDLPAEGQDAHDLDMPAPGVKLLAPAASSH
jgi:periplasmic copper chaperone A